MVEIEIARYKLYSFISCIIRKGSMPNGLYLDPINGAVSGTPNTVGNYELELGAERQLSQGIFIISHHLIEMFIEQAEERCLNTN